MDAFGIREITSEEAIALQNSSTSHSVVVFEEENSEAILQAVRRAAEAQEKNEAATAALVPDAYRLSGMSESAIAGIYRKGKESMSAGDLVRYFGEMRACRIRDIDFTEHTGMDVCMGGIHSETCMTVAASAPCKEVRSLAQRLKGYVQGAYGRVKLYAPSWIDTRRADTAREQFRFPVSAFAAVLVVAVSLMLIVASSVLLTQAESSVSRLQLQVSNASADVAELKSNVEVQNNFLEIRRIAIEEYGMVGEEFVKSDYISLSTADSVEAFEEERDEKISLSALLSAIGIGRGE